MPNSPGGILLVDDDPSYLRSMERFLGGAGIGPVTVLEDGHSALRIVEAVRPGVVCLDLDLGGFDGRKLISLLHSEWPDMGIVVVSGVGNPCIADECRRAGAVDYLRKPFHPGNLLDVLRRYRTSGLDAPGSECSDDTDSCETEGERPFAAMLTRSACMEDVFRYAAAVAPSSLPILITGETGTGKELMARALHQLRLSDGPFVAINTAGLDDSMFSDALFGHVAGAFTGGEKIRPGLVETAGEGTLFLDEIGDLSPVSQVKLLRLLQEGEYFPVGADRPRRSRCRFVLATHKDIGEDPGFRKDLYWRLCSHRVHLPPLRERPADIELLARHFVAETSRELRRKEPAISEGFVYDQVARCDGSMLGSTAMRVGEALGCEYASRTEDGCGTSPWCSTCGLAVATMASQAMTETVVRRCVLRLGAGRTVRERHFAVFCAPIHCEGPELHLVQFHELEDSRSVPGDSAFWDRLREMASDVSRLARSLDSCAGDSHRLDGLAAIAADLLDEIDAQMFLLRGTGMSDAFDATFRIGDLLDTLRREAGMETLSKDREIRFVCSRADMVVRGKRRLVHMVLRGMILNALEASRAGDIVDVHVEADAGSVVFSVRNDEVILPHFALRVFQKHFTTRKGTGRGTGTWTASRTCSKASSTGSAKGGCPTIRK